ncbi:helix-turn-helix transcriptional regulator [Corynebacterium endometrii]|uniref:Anaerobic benzoate catabolism transcriptional regulator n=1 Tax=Corynebacterium endometrii TaxID=2488819 RepID=A0A4P7QF69_9CORY|nr:helix-turn-helix transcriptional regulator [Corynebacterium endometrii]QCB28169.1 anaerobic benzoate catabolism transcriptional regulator [Corynebacterium endometrii]
MTTQQAARNAVEHPNMVRKWRRWKELSQAELASAVSVSRQTIANIEKGNYSPSVHLALAICHELGKSVEEIFGDEQEA